MPKTKIKNFGLASPEWLGWKKLLAGPPGGAGSVQARPGRKFLEPRNGEFQVKKKLQSFTQGREAGNGCYVGNEGSGRRKKEIFLDDTLKLDTDGESNRNSSATNWWKPQERQRHTRCLLAHTREGPAIAVDRTIRPRVGSGRHYLPQRLKIHQLLFFNLHKNNQKYTWC